MIKKHVFIKTLCHGALLSGFVLLVIGCTTLRGFKPPLGPEEGFKIPGQNTTRAQTTDALRACGYYDWKPLPPSPDRQEKLTKIQDDVYACMESRGFVWEQ